MYMAYSMEENNTVKDTEFWTCGCSEGTDGWEAGNRCGMSSLRGSGHSVCENFWCCQFMILPMHFVLINKQKEREREQMIKMRFFLLWENKALFLSGLITVYL